MNRKYIAFILVAIFLTTTGLVVSRVRQQNFVHYSRSESLAIINSATSIESYRVNRSGRFGSPKIGGFFITGKGISPDQNLLRQTKAILTAHLQGEANPHGMKNCVPPEPGVALCFIQGKKSVEVLFCFQCYDLLVINDEKPQWRDFYAQKKDFEKITKSFFPGDTEIQKLDTHY